MDVLGKPVKTSRLNESKQKEFYNVSLYMQQNKTNEGNNSNASSLSSSKRVDSTDSLGSLSLSLPIGHRSWQVLLTTSSILVDVCF